ncbi:MAG: hypothetical protein PHX09_02630 [Clostridia bacterium]|nr:hypothetical protein [Clostridia bacterium]
MAKKGVVTLTKSNKKTTSTQKVNSTKQTSKIAKASSDKADIEKTKDAKKANATDSKANKKRVENTSSVSNSIKKKDVKNIPTVNKKESIKKSKSSKIAKKTNKNKKGFNFFHIFALIIFSGILGGSYILYNNVLRPQYTIQFVDAEGIEYGDYPSITVKSGDSFTFTVTVNEGLSYYPQFNGITANGKKLEKNR